MSSRRVTNVNVNATTTRRGPPASLSGGVIGLAPVDERRVLVRRVGLVVVDSWAVGIAHPSNVPCRAHLAGGVFGVGELGQLSVLDLVPQFLGSHGPAAILSKENLVELFVLVAPVASSILTA